MTNTTEAVDTSTAVVGYRDIVTTESHRQAMTAQWNKALELAAGLAETRDPTTDLGDHIARAIRARMDPPR